MADRNDSDESAKGARDEKSSTPESSSDSTEHIDLSAVQADDALLDALGGTDPAVGAEQSTDQELNAILVEWRREIDSEPFGELVDIDTAVATIAAARPQVRRKNRYLVPLATAAAVLAITFTGVSVAAREARPGDTLWGLSQVLFTEHANSVEAASKVQDELAAAQAALFDGRMELADAALKRAGASLSSVSDDDGHAHLLATHDRLREQLAPETSPEDESQGESTTESEPDGEPPVVADDSTTEQPSPPEETDDSVTSPPEETSPSPTEEPSSPSSPPPSSEPPPSSDPTDSAPETSTGSRTESISPPPSGGE
ncbi:anti-sigma-D factor RsdA [Actinoalloteichus hymeniacidonis]|uniref:Anti-sigma-D factor RsdA sigma factor binding region domain-containing protein n=1 Tax=Actinoalloteichus hymeniacidonis TaxID=340345 RepID=A0AAC9HUC2_9PSEU|nr:anti-sigma-D factor RsdA [Actinoalloteichus hymeniacidonis]AOS65734.1 hypothetical protein TL08_24780 [Actinoalloteichus hymeniacidonis]MBB5906176.1 hypothetical protein [Actinoalloteichus hymeniacidonis]